MERHLRQEDDELQAFRGILPPGQLKMNKKKQLIIFLPLTFISLGLIFYSGIIIGETKENSRWFVGPYSDHLSGKDKVLKDIAEKLEAKGIEKEIINMLKEIAEEIEAANKIMKERK